MEAVNSLAGAAANAVWGSGKESSQEPVSGKQGDPSKGEPYDAGNMGMLIPPHPSLRDHQCLLSVPSDWAYYIFLPGSAIKGARHLSPGAAPGK